MTAGIYKIINQANNRIYIGSSCDIENRITSHIRDLKKQKHVNPYMQNDFNKTGGQFKGFIIEEIKEETERLDRETLLINEIYDNQNNCYNIKKTAFDTGSRHKKICTEERRKQSSEIMKNLWKSEEFAAKVKASHLTDQWKKNNKKAARASNAKYYNVWLVRDDGTEEFISNNLMDFCQKYNISSTATYDLINGFYKQAKGWQLKTTEKIVIKVKNKEGEIFTLPRTYFKFCKDHNMDNSGFSKMLRGKKESYKGWSLVSKETIKY